MYVKITMDTVCECPFAIRRGDRLMARASYGIGDGKLQFNTPVFEGDEIRLAYGNPDIIYAEVFADAAEVRRFQPQALMLIACMNRTLLLKEDVEIERSFYSPAVPEKALYHGHSEILYDSEGGGDLNSSLVSVAFREGEPTGATPAIEPCHRDETCPYQAKRIPLVLRMTSFLNAITGDLESEVEKAREANEAKTRFLSSVSHEIRTPINAVLGLDEMILRESSEADIRKYAIDIQNSGRTLLSLINDLLDSSRIDSGKMELIPVEYELSSLLNDLVNMTAVRAEEKNLKLAVNVDFNIPHILYGDDTRIKQCVLNILTNAVKYTETGSVEMTVGFRRLDEENIGLSFAVKDTGIGIREEDIPKLYRPFERIEEARNRGIEGTGLGMNIVLSLLKLMGSELKVESVYGEGSTFSFEITQKVVKDEPIGDFSEMYRQSVETTVNYHESFRAPEARLLVVDDTRMNLTVIRGLLKATQVKINTAESGKEALSLVSKYHYDIIFLDQRMPQMDGIETLRRMKHSYENINQGVPVIMLTANAMSGAREMFLEEGFDDYLTKPINGKKLEKTIRELLPPEKLLPPSEEDPKAAGSESEGAADGDPYASSPFLSALNRIPGLSVKEGLENCMDEDILRATIRDYAQAAGNTIERIKSFINDHDIENYTITVHALKSSSRIIGAGGLSEQAKYLEACGDEGNTGEIHEKTPALLQLYGHLAEQLLAALEGRLGEAGAPGPSEASASGPSEAGWEVRSLEESEIIEIPPIEEDDAAEQQEPSQAEPQEEDLPALPEDQLDAALAGVRELVEAFDFDGAADILNMLSGYSLTEQVKARTASLSGHIARLERDEILKEL